jgi:hypothetical protein
MFGISDPWVWLAYCLCLLSTALCVVWGISRWNWEEPREEPPEEIKQWATEEKEVEKDL